MLVRAYRLSDKFGIVILKLSVAFGWLSEVGVTRISSAGRRGIGGIIGIIVGLFAFILGIFRINRLVEK